MSSSKSNSKEKVSYSSIDTQRELRIEKVQKLKAREINPYTPYSNRDFTLGFVRFWFDFVHKFDLSKIENDDQNYVLNYFLEEVLFPQSLLEQMEEKLQIRHTVREMGLDPDGDEGTITDDFDADLVSEARSLIHNLSTTDEDLRLDYLNLFLKNIADTQSFDEDTEYGFDLAFKKNHQLTLVGRIKSKRTSGKIAFATVEDETLPEGFQFIFKKDDLEKHLKLTSKIDSKINPSLSFEDFVELLDDGDYIQVNGVLDYSMRGEPSLFVHNFTILTKSLRPLPKKLEYDNLEERYTNRVVDFKMNTKDAKGLSVRNTVALKSRFWQVWREEMEKENFLEVECPIFEHTPGGAEAKPFTTFYNELEQDVYLRISLELPLKRLIAGGFEKVYEVGRIFRNEGSSPQHLQEYTQLEWYGAYLDYNYGMQLTQRIYRRIATEILGSLIQTDYHNKQINWGAWCSQQEADKSNWEMLDGWPKIPYFEAIKYYSQGKIDVENKNLDELVQIAKENGLEDVKKELGVATIMDKIWKKIRVNVINPIFLILPPVELEPLAKRHPNNPKLTERFQVVAGGAELGKGFSELNDPLDQMERFEVQQKARDAGNEEAQFMDMDYVESLELGTPPMAGFGTSERLFSFFLGKHIKECVTFPHTRGQQESTSKTKKTLAAHTVILNSKNIPVWSKLNAAAHLAASLAAREGKKLIHMDKTTTADGVEIPMNIQHAIVMKQASSKESLIELKLRAEKEDLVVTCFTEEMRDSSSDEKVKQKQEIKNNKDIEYLGILVFGEIKKVEKLTKDFEKFE